MGGSCWGGEEGLCQPVRGWLGAFFRLARWAHFGAGGFVRLEIAFFNYNRGEGAWEEARGGGGRVQGSGLVTPSGGFWGLMLAQRGPCSPKWQASC